MQAPIAVIDNYDSFTYNLVQYLETLGAKCDVFLNDAISVDELLARRPRGILLSPGPGTPMMRALPSRPSIKRAA